MEASNPDDTGTIIEEAPTGATSPSKPAQSVSPSKAVRQKSETSIEEEGQETPEQQSVEPGDLPSSSHPSNQEQSGVLWKRRDIFKNLWRPRWFVLQSSEHVLTYYLLSNNDTLANASINVNSTPSTSRRKTPTSEPGTPGVGVGVQAGGGIVITDGVTDIVPPVIDDDVAARGAIYLLGCQVEVNETLSRPDESLYAFTISPPSSDETECHLAARSPEARAYWVELISHSCGTLTQNHPWIHRISSRLDDDDKHRSSWKSLDPPDVVFEHIAEPLAARLEQSLETNLELCEDTPELRWTPLQINVREGDPLKAYQRTDLRGRIMIKSTTLVKHHPKQVFNTLVDPTRRKHFETNVAENQRLEVLNSFTYFDYYCYKAIWPTSARDFATVFHWQVVHRSRPPVNALQPTDDHEDDQAIAILSFSCPEADAIRSPELHRVRAHLQSSFFLLRLVQPNQCEITRILSYDLGGRLKFNKTIMKQQAGIPGVIDRLLAREEGPPEDRLCTGKKLSNQNLIDDVLEHLPKEFVLPPRRLDFRDPFINDKAGLGQRDREHQWIQDAVVLLIPVMFYQVVRNNPSLLDPVVSSVDPVIASILFCLGIYLAFRHVVVCHLGNCVGANPYVTVLGPTTCRFSVDLKGVARFLHNREDDKRELLQHFNDQDVSVDHVMVNAVARAMAVVGSPIQRYVSIPFLFIHNNFRYPESSLDISILSTTVKGSSSDDKENKDDDKESKGADKSKQSKGDDKSKQSKPVTAKLVTLENVTALANIQKVAKHHAQVSSGELDTLSGMAKYVVQNLTSNKNWWEQMLWKGHRRAKCLILIVPDWDQSQHTSSNVTEVDFTPHLAKDVDILVVVGGINGSTKGWISAPKSTGGGGGVVAAKESKEDEDNMATSLRLPTKQKLFVSVSTNWNTSTCRDFSQELQKCIQFPEICDNE